MSLGQLVPRALLFGNPVRASFRISPDGRFLSWLAPEEGVLNVWIAPLNAWDEARALTHDRGRGIRVYAWTYDGNHLLFMQDTDGDENFHVHAVDVGSATTRDLTPFPGVRATITGISPLARDRILVDMNLRDPRFPDPHTVHLPTGEVTLVTENTGFSEILTDALYRPRVATRFGDGNVLELLRRDGDRWVEALRFGAEDTWTSATEHLAADGDTLYLRDSRGRNTAALVALQLANGKTTVLAEHAEADVSTAVTDIATREPLAYGFEVERPECHAIDTRLADDIGFLKAKGMESWSLVSRTEDDQFWVIEVSSSIVPQAAYLFDRQARSVLPLPLYRPELTDLPLLPREPVTLRARDGLSLVSYLTRPAGQVGPAPTVLLVHGGPWARDQFGFDVWHQWLANRGYAVLSVNFRASTGFGKTFVNAGDGEWGGRMDDDLQDAVAWAVREQIADPARVAIMGGSYGGYAVLAGMMRNPELYACGIDLVGPSNLETLVANMPPYWEAFRTQILRAIGDPSTEAGLALLRDRSPLHRADEIRRPLLIAQGANDPRVTQLESDQIAAALERNGIAVTYLLFPDEGHGFARPENNIAFAAAAELFLAQHLGGAAEPLDEADRAASSMQVVVGGIG